MKKQLVIAMTVSMLMFPLNTAFALAGTTTQNALPPVQDTIGQTVNPGITPDSPFYGLSNLIQKLQLILTFDPAQKAALEQRQALEQLAGAEAMQKEGKPDLEQKALSEYTEKISAAQQFLTQIKDPNSDAAKALQTALTDTSANNIAVLSGLLDKLPPQAAQKIALNIVGTLAKDVKKEEVVQKALGIKGNKDQEGKMEDQGHNAMQTQAQVQSQAQTQTQTRTQTQAQSQAQVQTQKATPVFGEDKKPEIAKEQEREASSLAQAANKTKEDDQEQADGQNAHGRGDHEDSGHSGNDD